MARYNFLSMDAVLARYYSELRGLNVHESDAIEWAGHALGFMKVPNVSEEAVAFMEVKNHVAKLPCNMHYIIQVARYAGDHHNFTIQEVTQDGVEEPSGTPEDKPQLGVCLDENGNLIPGTEYAYYRPYFDLQYEYLGWFNSRICRNSFGPVRLANHTFKANVVCSETDERMQHLYKSCVDEYTIIPKTSTLKFSFKEGYVAVAFLRQMIDETTGYPMVPDNEYCLSAITYYMQWKLWQRHFYLNRDGAERKMMYAKKEWEDYIKKFKNHAKMPQGIDDYEDLKESQSYMIPRRRLTQNYFGNFGYSEQRRFNYR